MKNEKRIKLIECMKTWQGEGVDSGISMLLCRFKYCNLSCLYCDTQVKMRISKEAEFKISDLQKEIYDNNLSLLVTGGEPTIKRHFDETLMLLNELEYPIANVETNGYNLYELTQKVKEKHKVKYIYSPKIFSKKDLEKAKELTDLISSIPNVHIKIVYEDNSLIEEYLNYLYIKHQLLLWQHRIWLMPEGVIRAALLSNSSKVFDICEKYNFNFSSRNHIIYNFL